MKVKTRLEMVRALRACRRDATKREAGRGERWDTTWRLTGVLYDAAKECPAGSHRRAYLEAVGSRVSMASAALDAAERDERAALAELSDIIGE